MNQTFNLTQLLKFVLLDIVLLSAVFFLPALAHSLPFPMYYLDPMRLLLFAGFLISKNKYNALVLAAMLPLISTLISGHPIFFKSILISIELVSNLLILIAILSLFGKRYFIPILLSILGSKLIYYFLKFIFIQAEFISGSLISTPLWIQGIISCGVSIVIAIFFTKSDYLNQLSK